MSQPAQLPGPEELASLLRQICATRMPFGKYGPSHFPPDGVPLCDLPTEYLTWFQLNGFPKGKIGYLLQQTWQIKANDLSSLFDPFRSQPSPRRPKPKKSWNFQALP